MELDPYHIDAKINVEYCKQKMNFTTENSAGISQTDMEELEKTDDVSRVLDFVRRRETNIWKAATLSNSDSEKLKDW